MHRYVCTWVISILNVETKSFLGWVEPHGKSYQVRDGDDRPIGVVGSSMNDAGRILAAYYKKHSRWGPDGDNGYYKWTEYGLLQVKRAEELDCWFVSRNAERDLMRDGEVATFPTPQEAQTAAEAHRSDGWAGSRGSSDGLSWFIVEKLGLPQCPIHLIAT
jgi:hypothetical protein